MKNTTQTVIAGTFVLLVLLLMGMDNPNHPRIVAHTSVLAQTQALPPTQLFPPTEDGEYRITITTETPASSDPTSACIFIQWRDDFRSESSGNCAANTGNQGSQVLSVHALANTPITFSSGGTTGDGYNAFLTVEQL